MMLNRYYLIAVIIIVTVSCKSFDYTSDQICFEPSTFEKEDGTKYIFNADGTYRFLNNQDLVGGMEDFDTISFGKWRVEKNFVVINSHDKLGNKYPEIKVTESLTRSKDSLYFFIQNDYAGIYKLGPDYEPLFSPYFYYKIDLNGSVNKEIYNNRFGKKFTLPIHKEDTFRGFSFYIYPEIDNYSFDIVYNRMYTQSYSIINQSNNTFTVTIKDFSFKNFLYKRYKEEYIKIVDCNILLWDGEILKSLGK